MGTRAEEARGDRYEREIIPRARRLHRVPRADGRRDGEGRRCDPDCSWLTWEDPEKPEKSRAHAERSRPRDGLLGGVLQSRRRLTEALNINSGLLALKRCVGALHEARKYEEEGTPLPHVPFHDSKLTTLSIRRSPGATANGGGGDVRPRARTRGRDHQSLRFGEKCSSVETRARVGADDLANAIAKLNGKIADCEEKIRAVGAGRRSRRREGTGRGRMKS